LHRHLDLGIDSTANYLSAPAFEDHGMSIYRKISNHESLDSKHSM